MPITRTANAALQKPATTDRNWDVALNANADALDAVSPLSSLMVTLAQYPSSSLNVKVAAGAFVSQSGAYVAFAGNVSYPVPANTVSQVWLTDAGILVNGAAWPAVAHVRLASVVAGPTTITSISDRRSPFRSATS
jgi:hypothetical protein